METKLAQVGERSLSYTVGDGRVDGVGERAHERVSGRNPSAQPRPHDTTPARYVMPPDAQATESPLSP